MDFLRLHWFDLGVLLAAITGIGILFMHPTGLTLLLWLSLVTLFLHQFEEYRYPGYFPGMMNTAMYGSQLPDRYPLNTQTSLIVNVLIGWLFYLLAALFSVHALWLGIATLLVSLGNFIAHTFLFNIRGKTLYNPGMLTAIVLFLPLAVYCFFWIIAHNAAAPLDWISGVLLGAILNYVGILKMIDWLKDKNTPYVFPSRCLVPEQRKMSVEG